MRRLGFAYNPTKQEAILLRDRALAWCRDEQLSAWVAEASDLDSLVAQLPESDGLVVLGGDGTFLRAAQALATVDVPVLGVNSGRVGFLSKVEPDGLESTLELLCRDAYDLEERMMLEATILPGGSAGSGSTTYAALNDAAIVRGAEVRVVRLEVLIDTSHLATYIADGLVVATPTGSTAYSFSAGGPILGPTARNLVVTPIAAYLSSIRSIVVGDDHTVLVRVLDGPQCVVSIDGREDHPLAPGDAVEIRALERPLRFIEPHDALPFWDLLRRKAALLPG